MSQTTNIYDEQDSYFFITIRNASEYKQVQPEVELDLTTYSQVGKKANIFQPKFEFRNSKRENNNKKPYFYVMFSSFFLDQNCFMFDS